MVAEVEIGLKGAVAALGRKNLAEASLWVEAALAEPELEYELHSLLLHLAGMLGYAQEMREGWGEYLTRSSELEAAEGCRVGGQHTSHQRLLLSQDGAGLAYAKRYYMETLGIHRTIEKDAGAGFCLRSLGEIALAMGSVREATSFWKRSVNYLQYTLGSEAEQIQEWISLLERARHSSLIRTG